MATPEDSQPGSASETSLQQKFFRYFQHEVTALQEQMDRVADRPAIAGERIDAADHCLAGISRLSSEVKDASTYLPAYDQRTYAEAIKALQEKLQEARATFAPKQKFSFKSARKSPSAVSLSDAAELAAQKRRNIPGYLSPNTHTPDSSLSVTPGYLQTPPNERSTTNRPVPDSAPPPTSSLTQSTTTAQLPDTGSSNPVPPPATRPTLTTTATSVTISSQANAHILLPTTTSTTDQTPGSTPCTISRLTSCVLDLTYTTTTKPPPPLASLTINSTTSSLLQCGTVNGPAHITNLRHSVLVVTCRQIRMHECEDVVVYTHCTSRPIIEDCRGVRFTTLPQTYLDLLQASLRPAEDHEDEAHGVAAAVAATNGIYASPNRYDQVDDFKWLKTEASPNWSVLGSAERVPEEVWREVVPGGPGWKVEDILKAVGVQQASGDGGR